MHIFDFIVEMNLLDQTTLSALLAKHIAKIQDAQTMMQILAYAIHKNYTEIFNQIIALLPSLPGYQIWLNQEIEEFAGTVLQIAMGENKRDFVQALLQLDGINLAQTNKMGQTILHMAASKGQLDNCKIGLDSGVDINQKDSEGLTPLYYAAANGQVATVAFLLSQPTIAFLLSRPTINELEQKAQVQELFFSRSLTVLEEAILNDHVEVVEILHKDGRFDFSQLDAYSRTLVHTAENSPATLEYLLSLPEIDFKRKQPPSYGNGYNILHTAADKGFVNIVKILIEKGMPLNERDNEGMTALHYAIAGFNDDKNSDDQCEIVRMLLAANIDKDAIDREGISALGLAVEKNHLKIMKILVEAGCKSKGILAPFMYSILNPKGHSALRFIQYETQNKLGKALTFFRSCRGHADTTEQIEESEVQEDFVQSLSHSS